MNSEESPNRRNRGEPTARAPSREAHHVLLDITMAANAARNVGEAVEAVLARVTQHNGWKLGHLWWRSPEHGRMVTSGFWYATDELLQQPSGLARLQQEARRHGVCGGGGIVGRVLRTGQPQWFTDLRDCEDWQRSAAEPLGLEAIIAFPVSVNGHVVAILEFYANHPTPRDEAFLQMMAEAGVQLGHVMQRKRRERQLADVAEREQRRLGHDIHEGVGQLLTGLRHISHTLAEALSRQAAPQADAAQRISEGLDAVQQQLRAIMRDLIPVELDEEGFVAALQILAERTTDTRITCRFECEQPVAIEDQLLATHLYRIVRQMVETAVSNANATEITIRLTEQDSGFLLEVLDNRPEPQPLMLRDAEPVANISTRADLLGLSLHCEAGEQGGHRTSFLIPRTSDRAA